MRKYVFADEAGNFDFSTKNGDSQFFILTTVTADSPDVGDDLLTLRRDLAWDGIALESNFHATEDAQAVRDQVFGVLVDHDFRIDTTILEKRKTKQWFWDFFDPWRVPIAFLVFSVVLGSVCWLISTQVEGLHEGLAITGGVLCALTSVVIVVLGLVWLLFVLFAGSDDDSNSLKPSRGKRRRRPRSRSRRRSRRA